MSLKITEMLIQIVPYDLAWPQLFEQEAPRIKEALEENCLAVHHIGSTSVPGLCSKSKIDIVIVLKDLLRGISPLENLGYLYKGELNIPFRLYFSKPEGILKWHLHVYAEGNPEIAAHLLFRNFLREHPKASQDYADLKLRLVQEKASHKRNAAQISGYNLGKNAFIQDILAQAGFEGLCVRFCSHYAEWDAARTLRQAYFLEHFSTADPDLWALDHKDHIHLVLYKGTKKIVGYAHLQLLADGQSTVRIITSKHPTDTAGLKPNF